MELSFPEKYYAVATYFDLYFGNIETTPLLTDVQRLMFYALRQQAEHGPCTTPAPSMWYMTERHKHQAWKQLGNISTFEAMVYFVQQLEHVLLRLESPEGDTAAASARPSTAAVDWPARLRDMTAQLTPATSAAVYEHDAGTSTAANIQGGSTTADADAIVASATSATAPLAGKAAAVESASPSPLQLTAEETAGWDADVMAHCRATLDDVRFLATEVMRVRQLLRQSHNTSAPHANGAARVESQIHLTSSEASAANGSPLADISASSSSSQNTSTASVEAVATGPPLKPIWSGSGSAVREFAVPPPLRLSARSMTEAAVRPPGEVLRRLDALHSVAGPAATPSEVQAAWFRW